MLVNSQFLKFQALNIRIKLFLNSIMLKMLLKLILYKYLKIKKNVGLNFNQC